MGSRRSAIELGASSSGKAEKASISLPVLTSMTNIVPRSGLVPPPSRNVRAWCCFFDVDANCCHVTVLPTWYAVGLIWQLMARYTAPMKLGSVDVACSM